MFVRASDGSAIIELTGGAVFARPAEGGAEWGLFAVGPNGMAILLAQGSQERIRKGLQAGVGRRAQSQGLPRPRGGGRSALGSRGGHRRSQAARSPGGARVRRLRIAPGLALPPEAVTESFGVLGQRGAGKSTVGVVMARDLADVVVPRSPACFPGLLEVELMATKGADAW